VYSHTATVANDKMLQARERMGDVRLSGKQAGDAHGTSDKRSARTPKDRKQDKANVVGRALRTVYDETLREDIPDDFLDLLGKLG
jgi:hypothetical protein